MATIEVTGRTPADAPSPLLRQSWWTGWNGQLTNLTAWQMTGGGTRYTCTSTDTVDVVTGAVENDLSQWCPNSPVGHCTWSVY